MACTGLFLRIIPVDVIDFILSIERKAVWVLSLWYCQCFSIRDIQACQLTYAYIVRGQLIKWR